MRKMARDSLFGDLPPPVSAQSNVPTTTSGQAGAEVAPSVPSILVAPSAAKRSVADTENQGMFLHSSLPSRFRVFELVSDVV